ncbi:MAG: hypothetical protein J3K34DRAFT_457660 [Monoraphidium minutum]|nr:MAG: hypothetical protein J3K34DRAFT_457660 [Monoraphidium minutum]
MSQDRGTPRPSFLGRLSTPLKQAASLLGLASRGSSAQASPESQGPASSQGDQDHHPSDLAPPAATPRPQPLARQPSRDGSEDGGLALQPDLAQALLDQSRGWDAEKRAALERFMTRPRGAAAPPPGQQPSSFMRHIQELRQEPPAPLSAGPLSSFYRILKDAPSTTLLLPAPSGAANAAGLFGGNGAAGAGHYQQQQQQQPAAGAGAMRRTPARGAAGGGGGGATPGRYDPYLRPTPLRPPSRQMAVGGGLGGAFGGGGGGGGAFGGVNASGGALAGGAGGGLLGGPLYSSAGTHRPLTPFPVKGPSSRPGTPLGRAGSAGGAAPAEQQQHGGAAEANGGGAVEELEPPSFTMGASGSGLAGAPLALMPVNGQQLRLGARPPSAAAAAAAAAPRLPRAAGGGRGSAAAKGAKAGTLLRPMRNTPLRLPGQQRRPAGAAPPLLPAPAAPTAGSKRAAEVPLALTLALEGTTHHFSSASKRMRPSTPTSSALRAMANLGSAPAPAGAGGAAAATPGGAGAAGTPGSAGRAQRQEALGALTPAAASILSTLEHLEKVLPRVEELLCLWPAAWCVLVLGCVVVDGGGKPVMVTFKTNNF